MDNGTRLGPFQILAPLGAGGMGEVFLAEDLKLGRRVAIKVLTGADAADDAARARLLREARAASGLNHPNICTLYEAGEADGLSYIAMEHVEGRTLAAILKDGPVPAADALRYGLQIADAVAHAHDRGFLHRDLKCANIMVTPEGRIKLLDFGLACRTPDAALGDVTRSEQSANPNAMSGTLQYMAPELLRSEPPTGSADLWALGVVLYNMVTGRLPFSGRTVFEMSSAILTETPAALPGDTPPQLRAAILRCLEKNPAQRYARASEVRAVLEVTGAASMHAPTAAPAPANAAAPAHVPAPRTAPWRAAIFTGLAIALAACAALAYFMLFRPMLFHQSGPAPTAQELYLSGTFYGARMTKEDNAKAIALFEQAVARDPNMAAAWGELALAYTKRPLFVAGEKDIERKTYVAIQRALALDPKSVEAHLALAEYLWTPEQNFAVTDAMQECRRAISLAPQHAGAHEFLAGIYVHAGLLKEAIAEAARTRELDPTNAQALMSIAEAQADQGNFTAALATLEGVPVQSEPIVRLRVAWCRLKLGAGADAAKILDDTAASGHYEDAAGMRVSTRAVVYAAAGDRPHATAAIAAAMEKIKAYSQFHHQTAFNLACAYALLKQPAEAVEALRIAAKNGLSNYPLFASDSFLATIKDDPGFAAFLTELKAKHAAYQALVDAPLPELR